VRQYIQQTNFDLVPTQQRLSFPMLKRYYMLLRNGHLPKAIHVAESAIVDGHHRYISGHLFGKCPEEVPSIRPKANRISTWANVVVDEEDYGKM
ncbi:MAG: hypothetical protein ACRCYO_20020, partial [Bacteroidia bacterium]